MKISDIVLLTALLSSASANYQWYHYNENYYVYTGCASAIGKSATFCKKDKIKKCVCYNEHALGSLLYCSYRSAEADARGINKEISKACSEYDIKNLTNSYYDDLYAKTLASIVEVSNNTNFNETEVVSYPISSEKLQNLAYDYYISNRNRRGNIKTSHILGIVFVSASVFVMILNGIINWSMKLSQGIRNSVDNSLTRRYRKFFSMSIFRKHLEPTILGFSPDVMETFWITAMFIFSILSCCIIGHKWYENDPIYTSYQGGTSRYWGDRACILLSYQLPLLFLFPGRNNFFQWVTRWKYARFVTYHKWLGRIIIIEVLIHACAMSSQTYALQKYHRFHADWYIYGIVSGICCCLASTIAIYAIRKLWYEIFLVFHIILVAMFLWTAWKHTRSQSYEQFYWTCCAIWIFDRCIRLLRILLNGMSTATIEYYPGDDATLKVHINNPKLRRRFSPGYHAFITFLSKDTFWQNHPFTAYESVTDPDTIIFCCRVKKGITMTIANKFKRSGVQSIQMKVLLDGFYGEQSYYQQYDKSVFITGNTGIVGPFAHIKKLASAAPVTRQVELYWGIRSYDALEWFGSELLSLRDTGVVPKIYISQPEKGSVNTPTDSTDHERKCDDEVATTTIITDKEFNSKSDPDFQAILDFIDITHHRMSVGRIIEQELKESSGTLAFGACANTKVVDTIRMEIAKRLPVGGKRVDYFEEMQIW